MGRRLIVTGASGFVAGSIIWQAGPEWEVHALSSKPAPIHRPHLHWHTLDVLDADELRRVFEHIRPSVVIHTAAIADINFCEANTDTADQVNIVLTRGLVELCREGGARMIFASTDTVFDGEKGSYIETDATGPVNYYGHTKVMAEEFVQERLSDWVIARPAIVLGLPFFSEGNSVLVRLLASLKAGEQVRALTKEVRTPVDVVTLGEALLELAGNSYQGILHLSGNDRMDRPTFSRLIAQRMGFPTELIVPVDSRGLAGRAPRPRDVSLDNSKARATLKTQMRGLIDGLERVLERHPTEREC